VSAAPDGALFIVRLAIAGAEVVAGEAGETGDVGAAGAGAAGCVGGAGCAGAVSTALWPTGPSRSSASSAVEPVPRGAIATSAKDHGAAGDALVGTRLEAGFCAMFRTAPRTVSFCCAEARLARANVAMTFSPGRPRNPSARRRRSGYGRPTRFGGQYVAATGPIRSPRATAPQARESHEWVRLSPRKN